VGTARDISAITLSEAHFRSARNRRCTIERGFVQSC
jgi:hypothetical protein